MEVLLQTYIHILQLKINEENSEKRKEQDIIQISAAFYTILVQDTFRFKNEKK